MTVPNDELEATRAALAPTLEAAAAILPWVVKPLVPRFPPALSERWQAAWAALADAWAGRHGSGFASLRPTVFALYGVAIELGDGDCLRLAESLATATDRLDTDEGCANPRLVAAISAALECFADPGGLEHEAFPERARHFAFRLERCATVEVTPRQRSAVLDRLFVEEAGECLERMADAFAVLPPDAYGMKAAATDLARLAESLEIGEIAEAAGRLVRLLTLRAGEHFDLDAPASRTAAQALVADLHTAVAAMGGA